MPDVSRTIDRTHRRLAALELQDFDGEKRASELRVEFLRAENVADYAAVRRIAQVIEYEIEWRRDALATSEQASEARVS